MWLPSITVIGQRQHQFLTSRLCCSCGNRYCSVLPWSRLEGASSRPAGQSNWVHRLPRPPFRGPSRHRLVSHRDTSRLEDALGQSVPSCSGQQFATQSRRDTEPWPPYPSLVITATHYPKVTLNDVSSLSGQSAIRPFLLKHIRLINQLSRRGAMTDYLDHPLIAARSGYHVVPFDD